MKESLYITKEQLQFIDNYLPSMTVSDSIANFFNIFGDNTRVRILSALSVSNMCVGDLCYVLKINQTTISHQLKLLKDANIVKATRQGRLIIYSICNKFVHDAIILGVDKVENDKYLYKYAN